MKKNVWETGQEVRNSMGYVIIGNSAAAIGCIEGIRRTDKKSSITVLSTEKYHTYARPLISYLLLGKTDEEKMKYRPDSFYQEKGVEFRPETMVTKLLPAEHKLVLKDGEEIAYDKLLVATGSRPFVPSITGLDAVRNRFTFLSLDDAKALQSALTPDSRVLIIGAGLIGLKCAEGIMNSVKNITICDLADRVLPSILDETGSVMIQKHLEKLGWNFLLGDSVQEFIQLPITIKRFKEKHNATDETDWVAKMQSGKEIPFDIVVIAVGVRPNTELVKEAGGEIGRGIMINERGETSLPDIYAAGDCTEGYDLSINKKRILALLPNAYLQGECAGINMSHGGTVFSNGIPMNSIGFAGLHVMTAGSYEGETYIEQGEDNYKVLFSKDNYLKGYILIGEVARAGIYTSLIRNRIPLDSIDYELICRKPALMAFTRKDRKEMLGL